MQTMKDTKIKIINYLFQKIILGLLLINNIFYQEQKHMAW